MRLANKAIICFLSLSFFSVQHMFPLSRFLSLVPTLFDPKRKEWGLLSLAISFSLQAAEREAEDIPGHMGSCGGALMTEWDAIPCYGAEGSTLLTRRSCIDTIKLSRWWTQRGMHTCCLCRGSCRQLKHIHTPPRHLYPPPKPNTKLKAPSRTKINVGNKQSRESMRLGEINNGKNLLWTNQREALLQIFSPPLPVYTLRLSVPQLHLCHSSCW